MVGWRRAQRGQSVQERMIQEGGWADDRPDGVGDESREDNLAVNGQVHAARAVGCMVRPQRSLHPNIFIVYLVTSRGLPCHVRVQKITYHFIGDRLHLGIHYIILNSFILIIIITYLSLCPPSTPRKQFP